MQHARPSPPVLGHLALLLALALAMLSAAPGLAHGDPHPAMRKSLVYLKASGITGGSGATVGQPVEQEATGFFVSDDGLILTTYHLLGDLGDVDGQTVTIAAHVGSKTGQPAFDNATIMNAAPLLDLLLLKVDPGIDTIVPVKLGTAESLSTDDDIYTSGFRETSPYHTDRGHLTSRTGPRGHLWTVSTRFESGQSGSPIYNAEGRVIGIAKGNDGKAPDQNYMVPIQFADPLLAHLRLLEMQKEIGAISDLLTVNDPRMMKTEIDALSANFDAVRQHFAWSGEFADDGRLLIHYSKLIAGEPHVERIIYSVDMALPLNRFTLSQQEQVRTSGGGPDAADGTFALAEVGHIIAAFRAATKPSLGRIRIRLVPVLADGTRLHYDEVFVDDPGLQG
jgi:hypothetical protein